MTPRQLGIIVRRAFFWKDKEAIKQLVDAKLISPAHHGLIDDCNKCGYPYGDFNLESCPTCDPENIGEP